jgi:trigger factor
MRRAARRDHTMIRAVALGAAPDPNVLDRALWSSGVVIQEQRMPYQVEETGQYSRVASVTVPAADFERDVNKALRELAKTVRLPGFRKGHVPLSVMRRNYGGSVVDDVLNKTVQQNVEKLLSDAERVLFMSQPQLESFPTAEQDLRFTFEYELRPQLDPVGYMGLGVERPSAEITDAEIDAEIERLRERVATLEPITDRATIADGDTVTFDFKAVGEDPALEELQGEGMSVVVGAKQSLPGIEEALLGSPFEGVVVASVTLPEAFPAEALRGQAAQLELKLGSVKKRVLPAVDDEFAVDTGMAQTVEELRAKLAEQLKASRQHEAGHKAEDSLVKSLLKQNDFALPPKFLEEQIRQDMQQQLQYMTQSGMDPSMFGFDPATFFDQARERRTTQLKTEFLLLAIAEKEKIKVEEADLKAFIAHQAQHAGVTPREFEKFIRSSQDQFRQAMTSALLEKTMGKLLAEAVVTEVPWGKVDEELEVEAGEAGEAGEEKPKSKRARSKKSKVEDAQIEGQDTQE